MAGTRDRLALTASADEALEAPWAKLNHLATGDPTVRSQALDEYEDAGRTENRVRHDYTGRYPIELLQNAHDACADGHRQGVVRFAVTPTALLVANEGVPFTPERIRSLVRLGSSEKKLDHPSRQTIGYKGVGFTAVFEITDSPQVISKTVNFGFDRRRARREVASALGSKPNDVPARLFPFKLERDEWDEDADLIDRFLRQGAATVIRLPFRTARAAQDVESHIQEAIVPEALLLMPHVRAIELVLPHFEERWTRVPGQALELGRIFHLRSTSGESRSWVVHTETARAPRQAIDALEDPLWQSVRNLHVTVALPWARGPNPDADAQQLYVYFPTDDALGRPLLVHGDFYVDSARRHIEGRGPGGEISSVVARAAATLIAQLSESLADRWGAALLECLSPTSGPSGFGETMGEAIDERLRNARIARPADGSSPRRPNELRRLSIGPLTLERELLPLLRGTRNLLRPEDDTEVVGDFLEQLGSSALESGEIARLVDPKSTRADYSKLWRVLQRWLAWIDGGEELEVIEALREQPIAQDTKHRWRVPDEVVLSGRDSPELPTSLRMSVAALPAVRGSRAFALSLGIRELTPDAAVEIVLAAVREHQFGETPREASQLHTFLLDAWKRDRAVVTSRSRSLGRVRVPARAIRGRRQSWCRADRTYFPSSWSGTRKAQDLYGRFGEIEFLAVPPSRNHAARNSLLRFYGALGVAALPRVKRHDGLFHDQ